MTSSFPAVQSSVLPEPPPFLAGNIRSAPLPTNSFFQNFVLKSGDQPEFIHPYIVKSAGNSLTVCYPSRFVNPGFIYQIFNADLTISAANPPPGSHVISHFDDLSVTLEIPGGLSFPLVRGSPYVTCLVSGNAGVRISTSHAILSLSASPESTKQILKLNNGQTWIIYSSAAVEFSLSGGTITAPCFGGVIRIAVLPETSMESVLDLFRGVYPVSGTAILAKPFSVCYEWRKSGGSGELLLLAHPLHRSLLPDSAVILPEFRYGSIDGDLVGVVGDCWTLRTEPIQVTWQSISGISGDTGAMQEISGALVKDVSALDSKKITTNSTYFFGKLVARAARLALIAEELGSFDVIPAIRTFLTESITPWLTNSFQGNGFLYDTKWGGLTSLLGSTDSGADFGFGVYNDHHYHLGYFVYAIAVLVKLDHAWGRKFKPQIYAIAADYMSARTSESFPKLRNFDMWKLHSWAGGLTEFADGRNQESTSEAVAAYYAGALLGMAFGDTGMVTVGSTVAAFEIQAAKTWWHISERSDMYEEDFTRNNRVVGVLWNNKRDSGLWFAPPDWKECRLGIQLLPLLPISEILFSNTGFTKELVDWTMPALAREHVGQGWKGFVYALEGSYDRDAALEKVRALTGFDDGNSLTNLLWWLYSRNSDDGGASGGKGDWVCCWFSHLQ